MNAFKLNLSRFFGVLLCSILVMPDVRAEDIDIYVGTSAGVAGAPNIMFLVDNSPNWSRAAQHWPDNSGNQGQAELAAISSILNSITTTNPLNVGLSMLSEYPGGTANGATPGNGGGYIRFGARDMSTAANRVALQNILNNISANITSPSEKLSGMPKKEESAGFYELYKYFSSLPAYSGIVSQNPYADVPGNANSFTGAGQGLGSGFALDTSGRYQSPITTATPCSKSFIIYIANNANNIGSIGRATYEPLVATAGAALAPTSVDTWTDEWTRFLYSTGAVVPAGNSNGSVVTYILDAYNAQQNPGYTASLQNAAKVGGGRYFRVGSQAEISAALGIIFAEIQGVNSTFASASLPVNSTNRQTDKNQVFIPVFRPDPAAKPLWMGNLKQYQFVDTGTSIELGDMAGNIATSTLTGFITDCATSFWTSDSGTYWSNVIENPVPSGRCTNTSYDKFSDAPDGPFVEKGGVAEVLRKGNNPPSTNTSPTWAVNRTIYTQSGGSLTAFNTGSSGLSAALVNFISGQDVNAEYTTRTAPSALTRPSIHGDAIHSQPTPVDYGGSTGVTVYYGANDGMLRAVNASTGQERWTFLAPEFFGKLQRLADNSPLINYPGMPAGLTPTPTAKDYFFDGSIGLYQNSNNSKVWIYPSMRRGGRMLYALDVTNPASPVYKWKVGCPNLANDTGCSSGFTGIGQTWSKPMVASSVLGYSGAVVIVGGGYDACEDANSAAPSCGSAKGGAVYVLDAFTGSLIKSFATTRSVAADVALLGFTTAGVVDHVYVADTGGNIYRIDFDANSANWKMNRIAYTNGSGRKFLFPPALLAAPNGQVFLAIGSGDREHPLQANYPYASVVNRFYVYRDDLATTTAGNLDDGSTMNNLTAPSNCATTSVLPGSTAKGWYMDLNQNGQGEQTVNAAQIVAGLVNFGTNRPVPPASGSCATDLGEARGYWVNLFNGSGAINVTGSCGGNRSAVFTGGGLPPTSVIGTVVINNKPVTVVIGAVQRAGGASSSIAPQQTKPTITPKRKTVYWKSSGEN